MKPFSKDFDAVEGIAKVSISTSRVMKMANLSQGSSTERSTFRSYRKFPTLLSRVIAMLPSSFGVGPTQCYALLVLPSSMLDVGPSGGEGDGCIAVTTFPFEDLQRKSRRATVFTTILQSVRHASTWATLTDTEGVLVNA